MAFGLHLEGIDKASARVRPTTSARHIFRANILFVRGITIRVKNAAIILEELPGHFSCARHFEVEDHTLRRRAVLPEPSSVILTFLVRCLHAAVGFVGLDIAAGQQVALHSINDGDQQLTHAQHRVVDGAQRHVDAGVAPQNGLLTKQWQTIRIFAQDEFDDGLIGEDRFGRDTCGRGGRGHALLFAVRAGALLAHQHSHKVLGRLHG
jgi:hypothetical protein